MHESRFGSAVVAYQGKMYVSGGFGVGKSILSSTEVYDPEEDRWTKLSNMKKMCGFVGGVLVERPVHFEDGGAIVGAAGGTEQKQG
jgi:N-acetylneuraminic acid mutarotase